MPNPTFQPLPNHVSPYADAIDRIEALIQRNHVQAIDLPGAWNQTRHLVDFGPKKPAEIITLDKDTIQWSHVLTSLESLVEFVNEYVDATNTGDEQPLVAVFVSDDEITANCNYRGQETRSLRLPLQFSPEWQAMKALFNGLGQKTLWRLLNTDLDGKADPSLALTLSSINVRAKDESLVEIQESGVTNRSGQQGYVITYPDPKGNGEQSIPLGFHFNFEDLRIFDATDLFKYEIFTRLETNLDAGLKFIFWPRRLPDILRKARLDIAGYLREQLSEAVLVYDGIE